MSDLGVYIHVPWCRKLCPYCDFAVRVVGNQGIPHRAYLDALLAELAHRAPDYPGRKLVSIYFGGGTPSLWDPACIASVISAVQSTFPAAGPLEITLEANPRDCTPEQMAAWQRAGINRVSVGVQSFAPAALAQLGRDHTQGDGAAALEAALAAGFDGVSADFILGVPASPEAPSASAVRAAEAGPGHLSVYELTIEDRTHFGKRARAGTLRPLSGDALADAYLEVHRELTGRGYEHYEISSYARPGARAVHNSLYWRGADYLGLGAGAASFCRDPGGGGRRWTNLRSASHYLRARGDARVAETRACSPAELAEDRLWLGLRTSDGVAETAFTGFEPVLERLEAAGLAERRNGRVRPTIRGFLHHDRAAGWIVGAGR